MSIARAFTTRRVRQTLELKDKDNKDSNSTSVADSFLHRSKTTKAFATHGSIRHKISAPVELTHTTNMLAYNAPDIFRQSALSTPAPAAVMMTPSPSAASSSSKSDDESDSGYTAASTPPTSPDTPFPDDKGRAMSPEPNHLSCYFTPPRPADVNGLGIATDSITATAAPSSDAPRIPQRAPSHTKKNYDGLQRHRSVSRMSEQSAPSLSSKASFSFSRSSSSSTSTSVTSTSHTSTMMKPSMPVITSGVTHKKEYSESHPFGHELAKVSELVEEFKEEIPEEPESIIFSTNPLIAEEERELTRQGLKKYSAESYISDIQSLMSSFFAEARPVATAVWI